MPFSLYHCTIIFFSFCEIIFLISDCTLFQLCDYFSTLQLSYMVSLQRYTKALSSQQRATLVEKSRQKPQERMRVVTDVGYYSVDAIISSLFSILTFEILTAMIYRL